MAPKGLAAPMQEYNPPLLQQPHSFLGIWAHSTQQQHPWSAIRARSERGGKNPWDIVMERVPGEAVSTEHVPGKEVGPGGPAQGGCHPVEAELDDAGGRGIRVDR